MSCRSAGRLPDLRSSAGPSVLKLRARPFRIALVGNPNVGKSVVFGRLTGRYATVANYPGTTVVVTRGGVVIGAEVCDVIDTPGLNLLAGALSEDERITRRVVIDDGADLVAGCRCAQPASRADADRATGRCPCADDSGVEHDRRGAGARPVD